MVTLRGNYMYEFLDRLVSVAIPRIKDFRGCNVSAFDGRGNYAMGVDDQTIFPEIDYDRVERITGLNIAIVTTAPTDREARSLLAALGMPFSTPGGELIDGAKEFDGQGGAQAQIQGARRESLPHLWPRPRLHA